MDNPNHPSVRFPEIWKAFTALQEEKKRIEDRAAPIREKRDNLSNKIRQLATEEEALRKEIEAIEHPRLPEIDRQLSGLAKAMGGRRMSEGASNG